MSKGEPFKRRYLNVWNLQFQGAKLFKGNWKYPVGCVSTYTWRFLTIEKRGSFINIEHPNKLGYGDASTHWRLPLRAVLSQRVGDPYLCYPGYEQERFYLKMHGSYSTFNQNGGRQ